MDEPEPGPKPRFSGRAVAVLGAVAVAAVALDQWVKWLSTENLDEGSPVRILGGLIYLSLLRNSGAAFGLGSDYTWIFPVITLVVIGWITYRTLRRREGATQLSDIATVLSALGGAAITVLPFGNAANIIARTIIHYNR